jgi:hypothetical protein
VCGRTSLELTVRPKTGTRRKIATAVVLAVIGLAAFWTRREFVQMYGGRTPAYVEWANAHYFGGLSGFYISAAESWRRGEQYTGLVYPPGYIALLAAEMQLAGPDLRDVRVVQGALDAATIIPVYVLAGMVGLAWPFALLAAAAYALLPLWAAGSTFLLAESVAVPLLLWSLVCVLWTARTRSLWLAALTGLWLGGTALVRPDLVLLMIVAAAFLVFMLRRQSVPVVLVLIAAFAIPIGSWGLHNRRIHGAWMLSSASSGATLWEGLGEIENDFGYVMDDSTANHVLAAHGYQWASVDGSAYLTREYLRAWRDHPSFVARVIAARVGRILFRSDRLQPLFFGRLREFIDAAGLAALVVAAWLRRRDPAALFVLLVLPLYAIGSIGLLHYEARYVRYVPVAYVLALLVVVSEAWTLGKQHRPQLTNVIAVCALLALATYTAKELRSVHAAATAPLPPNP